jgi:NADP-dependent 3-hydroxy acid dehydrogenase YdfG
MKVVLADIEVEALSQTEEELKASGASVLSVLTDISKVEDVEKLAHKTLDTFGEVHLLCNNAGVAPPGVTWECSMSDWKWVMDVNLWGVIHGVRTFIPIMLKQDNECHIVNTASLSGLMANEIGQGMYIATKYAVVGLTEILYRELSLLKSKIKVSVLCPAMVKTRIIDCERNRPAELCNDTAERILHPELEPIEEAILKMFEAGISPDKVGDIVFQAIKDDLFYILTDTSLSYRRMVKSRMDEILEAFQQNKPFTK